MVYVRLASGRAKSWPWLWRQSGRRAGGLGTARLGGIFTTLNTEFRRDYLASSLELSAARILVIDSEYAGRLLELESLGPIEHVFVKGTIPEVLNARPRMVDRQ
jgi:acyl-coenzyme A synthetase/AMP-(fatty) acid ligase